MTFSDTRSTDMARALTTAPIAARPSGAMATTDQNRAIAEVQAAMVIARSNPRDPVRCIDLIVQDCGRQGLAERALYAYARGGSEVTGPSIRLAEAIAQRWGNIQYGIREMEQRAGESVVQAYAWDVESNTRRETVFTVPHVRDTRGGRKELTESRDIYEITANMGARRLRACILGVIPGDVVDAAVEQVEKTLHTKADLTPDRLKKMIDVFAGYGVTREQIEKRVQRRIEAITPAIFVQLQKIATSLKDGMSSAADWFEPVAVAAPVDAQAAVPAANGGGAALKAKLAKKVVQTPAEAAPVEMPNPFEREPGSDDA